MQIKLTSVFVDDQDKALKFYTEVLGFVKKLEFPAGKFKWLTVVSPEAPEGVQLVLEPNNATTRPPRHINRRSSGKGYPRLISSSGTSKRNTKG